MIIIKFSSFVHIEKEFFNNSKKNSFCCVILYLFELHFEKKIFHNIDCYMSREMPIALSLALVMGICRNILDICWSKTEKLKTNVGYRWVERNFL